MFTSPGSIAFTLGPSTVRWYGLIIVTGILICYWYVLREARRRGLQSKLIEDIVLWIIVSGVIGARLYYVLFTLPYYIAHPLEIVQIWKGGLAIHGALLGGAAAFFIFLGMKKVSWRAYADSIIPGVLLAQAIGRWGNFFNNEAFGTPTSLPWKLFIPQEARPGMYIDFSYFHPTFLYESLWNLIGFGVLVFLSRRSAFQNRHGSILCAYLVWYSIGRFFIEGLRTDSLYFGQFRVAQLMSIGAFLLGIIGLIFLLQRPRIKA